VERQSSGFLRWLFLLVSPWVAIATIGGGGCSGLSCSMPDWRRSAPAPKASKVYFVVVEETSKRTPDAAKVLMDMGYWQGLRAQGHDWIFYDKDSPQAIKNGYVKASEGVSLPVLLVLDPATGKPLAKPVPLPASTAGVDAIKKEVTGQ
jgi:hypothetical protein